MHICIFIDQHMGLLGGVQSTVSLQKKYLERKGHTVTICQPYHPLHATFANDPSYIAVPSIRVSGEYRYALMVKQALKSVEKQLATRPPVDIVHIQCELWMAMVGMRYARDRQLPTVMTVHDRMDVFFNELVPMPRLLVGLLNLQASWLKLPGKFSQDIWSYVRRIALQSQAVWAPSQHFADLLKQQKIHKTIEVMSNGMDDELMDAIQAEKKPSPTLTMAWVGRISPEKRPMEFLRAFVDSGIDAKLELYGDGVLVDEVNAFIAKNKLADRVAAPRRVDHATALAALKKADIAIQASYHFETQGMSVFEAIVMGTPVFIVDDEIARELPDNTYYLADSPGSDAMSQLLQLVAEDHTNGRLKSVDRRWRQTYAQSGLTNRAIMRYEQAVRDRSVKLDKNLV